MSLTLDPARYLDTARHAHDLADLLKRSHPDLRDQVDPLQNIVTRAHHELLELQQQQEDAEACAAREGHEPHPIPECQVKSHCNNLEAAYQTLLELRHRACKAGE